MKKIICALGFLIVILVLAVSAQAGGSFSTVISITIPAIPGVNAPVIMDKSSLNASNENQASVVKTIYDK